MKMKNQVKALLISLAGEILDFMERRQLSKKSISILFNISESELDLLLKAELDVKLSDLIEISLKIDKIPRITFRENHY